MTDRQRNGHRARALEDAVAALARRYGGVEFLLALPLDGPHADVLKAAVLRSDRRAGALSRAGHEGRVAP